MNEGIFRKKNMDKLSSPEQLNDYIRVANPSVWIVLVAVIILLVGICVWGVFGRLDTTIATAGTCKDGKITCYVKDTDIDKVKEGLEISANGNIYTISSVNKTPVKAGENLSEYIIYLGNLESDGWVYEITAVVDLPNGDYKTDIVIDRVSPMSFVLN